MEATTNVFSDGASPSRGYLPEQNPIIPISYFLGIQDTGEDPDFARQRNQLVTWWQLVCLLGSYSRTPLAGKKDAPLFCPTVFRLDPQLKADGEPYDGPRNHLNATQSGAISVDLDDDCSFDFAEGWLRDTGVESLLYTTASHTIAKPRLRLLIPLAEPVDPATHLKVVKAIVNLILGRKLKDTSKSQCWSMFYFPAQYQSAEENRIAYVPGGFLTAQDWIDLGGVTEEPEPVTNGVDHHSDLPLPRDAAWDYSEPATRYLSMGKGSGRHVAFFGCLVSIAMRAIHAGYDLDVGELEDIARDLHRRNKPSKPYSQHDIGRAAAEALDSARSKVSTPAYINYQRWWEQVQREMDDWEPTYPKAWWEQARETVREIQQMRQPQILRAEPEPPEPAYDDDVDANPVHNFFGSLVPRSALTKDMLPTTIAENAWDEAERLGVTPDGVVMSNLMVCSGAISDAYKITPMLHNYRWKESARLWGLLTGDSGSKKTDQITPAAQPLVDLELRYRKQDDALMDEYDQAMAEYRAWQMNKDKGKNSDYEPEKPEKPRRRQFICNEFTMESLAPVLVDNTRGVIVINDEIAENLGSFDCYRAGGVKKDRAAALRLWNGGQWAINRVSTKDRPVLVENWSARYFGGIQPEKLAAMAPKLTDDGLLQRFLAAFSTNLGIGIDRMPNMAAIQDYHNLVESLATSNPRVR